MKLREESREILNLITSREKSCDIFYLEYMMPFYNTHINQ